MELFNYSGHGRSNGLHNMYPIMLGGSWGHASLDEKKMYLQVCMPLLYKLTY